MKKLIVISMLSGLVAMPAVAAEQGKSKPLLNKSDFAIGVGVAHNTIDLPPFANGDDSATGFQFFGAYDLRKVNLMDGVNTSVEFGYMDYGFDGNGNSGGVWATGVIDGAIKGNMSWLARLGFDFGDDDGFMFGAGIGFDMSKQVELRGEYVVRDNIDSLQLNLLYHL